MSSILTKKLTSVRPTPEELVANKVASLTKKAAYDLVTAWERGFRAIWSSESPEDVLRALGTDAAEVLVLSGKIYTLILETLDGVDERTRDRVITLATTRPPVTIHDNGTVTID